MPRLSSDSFTYLQGVELGLEVIDVAVGRGTRVGWVPEGVFFLKKKRMDLRQLGRPCMKERICPYILMLLFSKVTGFSPVRSIAMACVRAC
jgi:hypothetical protein